MGQGLAVYVLRVTARAIETVHLDEHTGSALRGGLFRALLRRFCMNPTAPSCAACPLNATCPVAALVAPLRDERPHGRDVPRPFVLAASSLPPDGGAGTPGTPGHVLAPGISLSFSLSLFGRAVVLFPYVAASLPLVASQGLGRPLRVNEGRRGRLQIERIELVDPFSDASQPLSLPQHPSSQGAVPIVTAPMLAVTPAMVAARAASLPTDRLTIQFLAPTRLIADKHLVRHPDLRILVARLAERLDVLTREYGPAADVPDAASAKARAHLLVEHAERAHLLSDETHWADVTSFSARQQRATPIGGFMGAATFAGDLTELREILVWGELLHVGKNAVKGDGHYRIEGSDTTS